MSKIAAIFPLSALKILQNSIQNSGYLCITFGDITSEIRQDDK